MMLNIIKTLLILSVNVILFSGLVKSSLASPDEWRAQEWGHTDFSKTSIKYKNVISGGPLKDGIPSIDKPRFHTILDEQRLGDKEPVIGLSINGDARAYPLSILMFHEIVNDVVGGVPVAVTYCPLCNTSIVFRRRIDETIYDFGTTGKLRFSDLIMYDRQTESWWQQFSGKAIVGEMLDTKLVTVPSRLESFSNFKARFPNGKVLRPDPARPAIGRNPYEGYDTSATPFLYNGDMPKGISPMARVIVVTYKGKKYAVAMALVRKHKAIKIGDIALRWKPGQNSALDTELIKKGRDVGNVTARKKVNGKLQDVVYEVTFAFAFHAFEKGRPIIGALKK